MLNHFNFINICYIPQYQFSSVTHSSPALCNPMDWSMSGFSVHRQLPEFIQTCPLNWWCNPTMSSSVVPFSSCLQSFPASGCFPMSWLFISGGQSIGASASASVLPVNIQGWSSLRLIGLILLLSKGFSGVFSSSTIWKHQFFASMAKVVEFQLQHQSFQWTLRTDLL